MLKAAEHEHEDWPVEPDELLRRALADLTHPDGDADEEVAEHAAQQRRAKGERRLHLRCRDNGIAHDVERPRRAAQPGDEHRAEEVPEVDERPAAQQRPQADPPLEQRDDEQAVACEQLAPGEDDHCQSGGEDGRARDLADIDVSECGRRARERDERAGQHAQQQKPYGGLLRFDFSEGEIAARHLCGIFHVGSSCFLLSIGGRVPV